MLVMLLLFWFYGVKITYGQAGSPWNTGDNDYYYDQLEPENLLPKMQTRNQEFSVQTGEDIVLPCVVEGLGKHSLVWRRGGNILWVMKNQDGDNIMQLVTRDDRVGRDNTSLTLTDIQPSDESTYTCEIDTTSPRKVRHLMKVQVAPSVSPTNGRQVVTIKMGSTVNLACNASGNPEPSITWSVRGKQLQVGANLTITDAGPEDNGYYKCTASNGIGEPASTSIRLDVMHPPKVRPETREVYTGVGQEATLACYVIAEPHASVQWYRLGGTPVDPMRLKRGRINFKRYSLQFDRVHLEDLGWYTCNATNFMGNNSGSIQLTAKPKPVRYVSPAQSDMETNYTLVWDVESYAPVLTYKIAYRNASDGDDQWIHLTVPGTSSSSKYHSQSHTFTDLDPGSSYVVKVYAMNEFGQGAVNESFSFTTFDSPGTDYPSYAQTSEAPPLVATNQSEAIVSEVDRSFQSEEASNASAAASEALVNQTRREEVASTSNEVSVAGQTVIQDETSAAVELTPRERKLQMMALVTAISLSSFFC